MPKRKFDEVDKDGDSDADTAGSETYDNGVLSEDSNSSGQTNSSTDVPSTSKGEPMRGGRQTVTFYILAMANGGYVSSQPLCYKHMSKLWHLFFSPLNKSDNHMLQFTWHLRFLFEKSVGFMFKMSKFKINFNLINYLDNHHSQIRLSDSKIYLDMSSGSWSVLDPHEGWVTLNITTHLPAFEPHNFHFVSLFWVESMA